MVVNKRFDGAVALKISAQSFSVHKNNFMLLKNTLHEDYN
jgi:hypothetical protein